MALRCPECSTDNALGTFYCARCESPLLPEAMIPPNLRRAPKQDGEVAAPSAETGAVAAMPAPAAAPTEAPPTSVHAGLDARVVAAPVAPEAVSAATMPPAASVEAPAALEAAPPVAMPVAPEPETVAPPVEPVAAVLPPTVAAETAVASAPAEPAPRAREETRAAGGDDARRYRIVLGDTCPVCRAVSRISFTADRAPQIPIVGCRESSGCRCTLPIFEADLQSALAAPVPSLTALAPKRDVRASQASPGMTTATEPPPVARRAAQPATPVAPLPPDWMRPTAITQQRERARRNLSDLYYQRRIQGLKILTAPDCCKVCADVASSVYDPSIAPTLPVVGCWNGWECRCLYVEEPLPLDVRGTEAMDRLGELEIERELRRRKIARGGPRLLHQIALVVAALIGAGALLRWVNSGSGRTEVSLLETVLVFLLAGIAAVDALGATRRQRPLPSPALTYAVCGIAVAVIGLYPLIGVHLAPGTSLMHLDLLQKASISPKLSLTTLRGLTRGQEILSGLGVGLLLLGVIARRLAPGYELRYRPDRRPA